MGKPATARTAARVVAATLAGGLLALATPKPTAALDLVDHGPTLALGYAEQSGDELAFPTLGWRWRWGFGESVDAAVAEVGTRLTWYVEPMLAVVAGDQTTAEFQVVPAIRIEAASPWGKSATPYLEGGIGLMATGLDDIGLGSNILFSDNVGAGLTFLDSGWSLGFRYRHASHGGLWAKTNAGIDVGYLTVRYDIKPPR